MTDVTTARMYVELVATTEIQTDFAATGYIPHWDLDQPEEVFEEANSEGDNGTFYGFTEEYGNWVQQLPKAADELAEAAGRLCYHSFLRPNPKTKKNSGYIENIVRQQHFSVLEHATATFFISGVSRALTHELVRHRHFSFSQVSQRYVNHSETNVVIPPVINELPELWRESIIHEIVDSAFQAKETYGYIYDVLRENGFSLKEARGAARAVLPEATETEIVVTGNHRAWREFLQKRLSPAADAEIRHLAELVLVELKKIAPSTYQDFEDEVKRDA